MKRTDLFPCIFRWSPSSVRPREATPFSRCWVVWATVQWYVMWVGWSQAQERGNRDLATNKHRFFKVCYKTWRFYRCYVLIIKYTNVSYILLNVYNFWMFIKYQHIWNNKIYLLSICYVSGTFLSAWLLSMHLILLMVFWVTILSSFHQWKYEMQSG